MLIQVIRNNEVKNENSMSLKKEQAIKFCQFYDCIDINDNDYEVTAFMKFNNGQKDAYSNPDATYKMIEEVMLDTPTKPFYFYIE